ncbi:AcrR family transcriptional regulator [Lipingzhangella halophila]|uniref:AcrR family transcriptional regulator n=1 Tax=Lipingzhangella halophila TaxID=1783352 RepID=A0A7W7RHJ1_9ACTN|nr:TetR/AcrR family transcriptional regulator [Lipingzhangella halophila]MBB4932106.1 AcrR family transcriptional regulator [Lipingzhangella halophila]
MTTEDRPLSTLELLWGSRERPRRGPRPKLTVERIVETAVEVADAEGSEALSMQRVAKEFGYTTMSLYRYVQSKEQLLELMFDAGSGPVPPVDESVSGWRAEIEWWVRQQQRIYQRHPWMLRVAVSGPPLGPNNLAWMEAGLRPLVRAGLAGFDSVEALMFITGAVREICRIEDDMRRQMEQHGITQQQMDEGYVQALKWVVNVQAHPTLAGMLEQGVFDAMEHPTLAGFPQNRNDEDAGGRAAGDEFGQAGQGELAFGLRRLFDGIERHVGERAAGRHDTG